MIVDEHGTPITLTMYTAAQWCQFEMLHLIVRSLIRQRAVDPRLAEEFKALASEALRFESSDPEEIIRRWAPIHAMMTTCTDPAAWVAR